jgi:branched-chain amino acid transport system ATP-binding protein
MTVLDNLLVGAYRRSGRENIRKALEDVWYYFPRLRERKSQHVDTLSGGEQQMCAIGRALMAGAKLMLLDEPSLGLAPVVVKEVTNIIQRLRQERGLTILMAEQNAFMALKVGDYGYVLEQGRIALEGKGQDLLTNENVIRAYIGVA